MSNRFRVLTPTISKKTTMALFQTSIDPEWETIDSKLCNEPDGPVLKQIQDTAAISIIKKWIISNWLNVKDPDNFPGPQPVSLERKDLTKLTRFPYVVCEKTDGMRYLLVALRVNNINLTVLVDRSFRMYNVTGYWSCMGVFEGTMLDGEVVKENDGTHTYYPHDCVMRDGVSYGNGIFWKRYEQSKEVCVLWRRVSRDRSEEGVLDLKFKKMFKFENLQELMVECNSVGHPIDGLVFTPIKLPVQSGTQHSLIKWKHPEKHTFDIAIEKKGQRYEMYLFDRMSLFKYKTVNKRTAYGKKFADKFDRLLLDKSMEELSVSDDANPKVGKRHIVECILDDGEYIPIKLRADKIRPNSLRTIEKTLVNIDENILIHELIEISKQK